MWFLLDFYSISVPKKGIQDLDRLCHTNTHKRCFSSHPELCGFKSVLRKWISWVSRGALSGPVCLFLFLSANGRVQQLRVNGRLKSEAEKPKETKTNLVFHLIQNHFGKMQNKVRDLRNMRLN